MPNAYARYSCRGYDWLDLEGMRHYPQVLIESGKRVGARIADDGCLRSEGADGAAAGHAHS